MACGHPRSNYFVYLRNYTAYNIPDKSVHPTFWLVNLLTISLYCLYSNVKLQAPEKLDIIIKAVIRCH